MPADDITDPAAAITFSHLDATTVLSRQIAAIGIYHAVDPLGSSSRILEAAIVGISELPKEDEIVVNRARKLQRFLSQPFSVAETFTGLRGRYVELEDTVRSVQTCSGVSTLLGRMPFAVGYQPTLGVERGRLAAPCLAAPSSPPWRRRPSPTRRGSS